MVNWKTIPLGNIAEFRNGVNFDNSSFGEGIKVINVSDFKDRMYPDYSLLGELDAASKWHEESFLKKGDIVFVRSNGNKNLIGRSIYIKNLPNDVKVTYSAFCIRLRFKEDIKIDSFFYLYVFKSPLFRALLSQFGNGANINNLNQDILKNIKIPVPELPTQKKIASILSAYDDLIENNNQRIKLLEEMAEEIYKEWFVRFRFPGYKDATFLDKEGKKVAHGTKGAIPEGWEKKPIKDIVDIISGYAFKTESFEEDGDYGLVTIKNVQNGFFVTKTTDYIKELPKNIKDDIFLKDKDILLSLTGNIGRICLVYGDNYLLNQRVAKLKPKTEDLFEYVYLFFRSDFLRKTLENYSNGAAQQNLSPVDTSELKFITPPDELLEKFSDITKSFFDEIILLLKKNQILQETRDLLLPRLISGKLSVEGLEVEEMNMAAEPHKIL
ncbi:restriction endonuclease subunit S [Maribacter ulvicola]|uniref:Type I restriction enzyme, S subunit n=1 Tax=Maribacter ulvicola TaxID=228959 RepID=A0A1N6WS97_9FLAO|nr:restriction endonuclease subunit S [Maribacter ulvicola]SIQ92915.1 type I restriction enzyme, S subunit [Maribacter ulvicola]